MHKGRQGTDAGMDTNKSAHWLTHRTFTFILYTCTGQWPKDRVLYTAESTDYGIVHLPQHMTLKSEQGADLSTWLALLEAEGQGLGKEHRPQHWATGPTMQATDPPST